MNPARTRPIAVVVAAALLATTVAIADRWDPIEHLPGQTPVTLLVEGKSRVYFRITPDHPLTVPVEGPARLRILSRVELVEPREIRSYTLIVSEGGREIKRNETESSASDRAVAVGRRTAIGKSRRMTVEVPVGSHRLDIAATGAAVFTRLHRAAPAAGEEPSVSLTPIEAPRSVLVTENEKTIPYYSVLPGKPVRLRVVGPTTLDLISRLDFDATMRGTQTYRLRISQGQRTLRDVEYHTTKATTAVFGRIADRIPSKYDRLQLAIGDGPHELTVALLAPTDGAVEIHARIPQPTVGGEE